MGVALQTGRYQLHEQPPPFICSSFRDIARFERSGGTFPVTEFWNNWDTPNIPSLPPPEVRTVEDGYFCITAHRNYCRVANNHSALS